MESRQIKIVPQKDLFQPQFVNIINLNHPLARLAKIIDWNLLEGRFSTVDAAVLTMRFIACHSRKSPP